MVAHQTSRSSRWFADWFSTRLFTLLLLLAASPAQALVYSNENDTGAQSSEQNLFYGFGPFSQTISPLARGVVDLIAWMRQNLISRFPDETEVRKYNRRLHFGGWVRPETDQCYNTRAVVLMRDADPDTIRFVPDKPCLVESGRWQDPYTGTEFATARSVQIDHVVALRHAYYAGGHAWTFAHRCHYANFVSNSYHLLAVSGRENMSKGHKSPEEYLPPSRAYQCRYIAIWMRIKAIWKMSTIPSEVASIEQTARERGCTRSELRMSEAELSQQRLAADEPGPSCDRPDPIDNDSSRQAPALMSQLAPESEAA